MLTDERIDELFYELRDTPGRMHRLLARAVEREALEEAAKACERQVVYGDYPLRRDTVDDCAFAIRCLKEITQATE